MKPTLIGQQLLNAGLITSEQLQNALKVQRKNNILLGQLAIEYGYLNQQQVSEINRYQRRINRRFGDIALQRELLTPLQIDILLCEQQSRRRRLGEILVQQDALTQEQLDSFMLNNQLPSLQNLSPLSRDILQHMQALFLRLLHSHCRHTPLGDSSLPEGWQNHCVGLRLFSEAAPDRELRLGLYADSDCLRPLAARFMDVDEEECDRELAIDACGEFLNTLAGYIISDSLPQELNYAPTPPGVPNTIKSYHEELQQAVFVAFSCEFGDGIIIIVEGEPDELGA
ncbi:hypothetical protein HBA55_07250 [Pseudomaricurvus alkylphenolicus]|jgi:hypothetical protein|uniref:hypothetical protein n=1 Tax=Pseudomaricurvus alkylphenolicus TaxID=1306991 RepID=UPI001421EAB5|nr:hypothetical protein [Pseudomaricurvus alkylphenolicus]NIB39375.1 hypothetical protein [Pseudomaricurvus alkylphenolicus]